MATDLVVGWASDDGAEGASRDPSEAASSPM